MSTKENKPKKKYVYIVEDAPMQGMKDFGIMGVYSSKKRAKEAVGKSWLTINRYELNPNELKPK